MPARKAILDLLLTIEKPVQRDVEVVLVGACDAQLLGER
jgi:hypothetical protein